MRALLLISLLLLAACTEATANRVDERTFKIEGPAMGGPSEGPNRRLANRLCPKGFRVIDSESHRGGPDRVTSDTDLVTSWTIRCI